MYLVGNFVEGNLGNIVIWWLILSSIVRYINIMMNYILRIHFYACKHPTSSSHTSALSLPGLLHLSNLWSYERPHPDLHISPICLLPLLHNCFNNSSDNWIGGWGNYRLWLLSESAQLNDFVRVTNNFYKKVESNNKNPGCWKVITPLSAN